MPEPDPPVASAGRDRQQLLRQPHGRLARCRQDARRRHVRERRGHRLANRRMAMPEARRAPGGGEVEHPAPVGLDQVRTLATLHRQRKEAEVLHSRQRPTITAVERFCHALSRGSGGGVGPGEARRVGGGVGGDRALGLGVAPERRRRSRRASPPGCAQVISPLPMPVRTRLSMQPTLIAVSPPSLAMASTWHCGLPSKRTPAERVVEHHRLLGVQPQEDDVRRHRQRVERPVDDRARACPSPPGRAGSRPRRPSPTAPAPRRRPCRRPRRAA